MNNSIKLAIAAYGLVGSISFNEGAASGYLEDDSLFAKTTNQLITGWEWGVSYALADDDMEVICCGTLPPGWNSGVGGGFAGGGFAGGGGSRGGNDASDGREGNGDSSGYQEYLARREECLTNTASDHNACVAIANGTAIATAGLCIGFVNPFFIAGCTAVAGIGGVIGNYECNEIKITAEADCRA
ncbi:hypothetical protein [Alteromonas stellipolaris]|uniref:hypothetical protein n=1 Tax=Alteromonas stellipolaris TaxID=233316 RepID=UPI002736779E|nr:hypothetical protein [Alteromonas stellipolaris]MDP2537272.1 hypothetical protein [Alteromonas stellipolaris]